MTNQRPSVNEMMMEIAKVVAKRSTCPEAQVGAVIATEDGRILAIGYNGMPRGLPHCTETGCVKDENGHHIHLVHAEANAIVNMARVGISSIGTVLYCTRKPCPRCSAMIFQAGIGRVIYEHNCETQDCSDLVNA